MLDQIRTILASPLFIALASSLATIMGAAGIVFYIKSRRLSKKMKVVRHQLGHYERTYID